MKKPFLSEKLQISQKGRIVGHARGRSEGRTVQKGRTVGRTAPKMQQNPRFFHNFSLFLNLSSLGTFTITFGTPLNLLHQSCNICDF
jgi:hypothetical protein